MSQYVTYRQQCQLQYHYIFAGTSKSPLAATSVNSEDDSESDQSYEDESTDDTSLQEDAASDGDLEENDAEGSNKDVAAEEYIIVEYEGQQFPGKVTNVESEGVTVST